MSKLTLSFKGRPLKVFYLDELDEVLIGRDPDCDIHVDSLALALHQARITRKGDTYVIKALDEGHPVLVNRHQIGESVLQHGDTLDLGKHTLTFAGTTMDLAGQEPAAEPPAETPDAQTTTARPSNLARLQILEGVDLGRIIVLDRSLVRLGRPGGQCAMISRRGNGYHLSHLEGEEPTIVDGEPIGDRSYRLQDGQTIKIGYVEFQFFLQAETQAAY